MPRIKSKSEKAMEVFINVVMAMLILTGALVCIGGGVFIAWATGIWWIAIPFVVFALGIVALGLEGREIFDD